MPHKPRSKRSRHTPPPRSRTDWPTTLSQVRNGWRIVRRGYRNVRRMTYYLRGRYPKFEFSASTKGGRVWARRRARRRR